MIEIRCYHHTETDDVDLGNYFASALPPIGALITLAKGVWRIVDIIVYPAMPGSAAVMHQARGTGQVGQYSLLVEPAEGPFHP